MLSIRLIEQRGQIDPIANAQNTWRERSGLLLRLEDDRGHRGFGEASPLPGHSRDTIAECKEALASLAPFAIDDADPLASLPRVDPPAARFALETAVLDLIGRRTNRSIAAILGKARERVPISTVLFAEDEASLIEEARAALARGVHTVKLKVGKRPLDLDLALVAALRNNFGDRIAIRLDANRAWSIDEANRALAALEPFAPELVEEPCATTDWDRLEPRVPLALDESLTAIDADRIRALATNQIASALVLKPMLLGGLTRCLELARLAAQLDLSSIVTHLFDGPIALAAASALALALPGRALAAGLDRHRGLLAWPQWAVHQLRNHEIVEAPIFGHGVEVAE